MTEAFSPERQAQVRAAVKKLLQERNFALAPPTELHRIWGAFTSLTSTPHPQAAMWRQAMAHYYGEGNTQGMTYGVTRRGDEAELAAVRVNTSRSLVKAKIALVTASQVTWAVREKKDSAAAGYATSLSRALLEDVWNRQGLATADVQWEELSQVLTCGYAFLEWDKTRGPDAVVDAETETRLPAGDCRLNLLPPWMVATDPNRDTADDQDWWFVAVDRPKVDLALLYPSVYDGDGNCKEGQEAAEAILSCRTDADMHLDGWKADYEKLQTLARVVHFIHRPTLALPLGRHVVMLSGGVILRDTTLTGDDGDYEQVPLVRRASDERIGTCFGYTSYFDCLGAQEIADAIATTQSTVVTTFGNPVLAYEKGTDAQPQDVAVFGRPWAYPSGGKPPQYVTPPELAETHLKLWQQLKDDEQQLLALNDAALGQPQTAERNAQAEALFASMAVQQAGPAVLARRRSLSQLGQLWLTTLRHNVTQPRLARMVGEGQANLMADTKAWTGTDLGPLDSVEVEEVAPEQATIQGRWAILEQYMNAGIVKSPDEMEQVRSTGRLNRTVDPIRDAKQLQSVQFEQLCRGEMPLVHPTSNSPDFYQANAAVLRSETALNNDKVRKAVEATLDLRYEMYFGIPPNGGEGPDGTPLPGDPLKLDRQRYLLGEGPLPAPMPPPGAPMGGMPGAPPDAGSPAPFGQEQPMPSPAPGEAMQGAPINPMTSEPFTPGVAPIQ